MTRVRTKPVKRWGAVGLVSLSALACLLFASGAQAATATVGLGTADSFAVLAGQTVTNTGPTTMFGDLGLTPGSSVTGAPHVLGTTHIRDAVALNAQNSLTTAYNDAAGRPNTKLASADLSGQTFTAGAYNASSSLLFSAGNLTLNAQGDPNAVFIFQVGTTLTTGSATRVLLVNGAQACNVFWQIGSSATLGTNSVFAGTVMALTSIAAQTGATLQGRLLARNGAVTLDTNTITTSTCGSGGGGGGGGTTTAQTTTGGGTTSGGTTSGGTTTSGRPGATGGTTTSSRSRRHRRVRPARRRPARHAAPRRRAHKTASPARPPRPQNHRSFTG